MDARDLEAFHELLLRQRERILREVSNAEAGLQNIAEDRESELEESAQAERNARVLARLDDRGKAELDEIERALARIASNRYGTCEGCGEPIRPGRLAALPATPFCRDCAERVERGEKFDLEPDPAPRSAVIPADYTLLTGRELEEAIREHLADDPRLDLEELRVVCRHGVVYLKGSLPSQAAHGIVLHTITDVMGLSEIVDRVQIAEILWERDERTKEDRRPERQPWEEGEGTQDVAEADEGGMEFVAPSGPEPDEE